MHWALVNDPAAVRDSLVDFGGRFAATASRCSIECKVFKMNMNEIKSNYLNSSCRWEKTTIWSVRCSRDCKRFAPMSFQNRTCILCANNIECIRQFVTGPTSISIKIAWFRHQTPPIRRSNWIRTACSVWTSVSHATEASVSTTPKRPNSLLPCWKLSFVTPIQNIILTES